MSQQRAQPDDEVRDFDAALELIGELDGRIVAIGMLTPCHSSRMTAVVRGRLKTPAPSKPPTDSSVRSAFFGLEGGPPNMGHWGPQGFYVSEPVLEYAKRTHGGVIVVLRDIVFHLSVDEQDVRLEGNDWLKGATLIRRRWRAPPPENVRAWRTAEGERWETANPEAEPMGDDWIRVEPRGWDHDHCELCWATLTDPGDSKDARQAADENPTVFAEGYWIAGEVGPHPTWIYPRCVDDLAEEFQWRVAES